jgi:hypothetical protein
MGVRRQNIDFRDFAWKISGMKVLAELGSYGRHKSQKQIPSGDDNKKRMTTRKAKQGDDGKKGKSKRLRHAQPSIAKPSSSILTSWT